MTTAQLILCALSAVDIASIAILALIGLTFVLGVIVISLGTEIAYREECRRAGITPRPVPGWMQRLP
jgi:hypothetical protein